MKSRKKRAEQQHRRRKNNRTSPKREELFLMIDGNYTHQPAAYCTYHKGFLTGNMEQRHGCMKKNCTHFHKDVDKVIQSLPENYVIDPDEQN